MSFRDDVLAGLRDRPRAIPARWFYDRRGSELFEAITTLPEYYPTRTEAAILTEAGPALAALVAPGRAVVEWGSGASVKTRLLLRAIEPAAYVPIDISGDFLRAAAEELAHDVPGLPIHPQEADFTRPVTLPGAIAGLPRLGFFPGSTIGNLEPAAAVDLLRAMRNTLAGGPGDAMLLIGLDRVKEETTLLRAYDDAAGVTAAFNLNLLDRINRELGGDVPLDAFRHRAVWNAEASRVEMHLEAVRAARFSVAGEQFEIAAGETIHTENSHKYSPDAARVLLAAGGWTRLREWTDERGWFSVVLAAARPARTAP